MANRDTALRKAAERATELRSRIAGAEAQMADLQSQIRSDAVELRRLDRFIASYRALARDEDLPVARVKNPDRREVAERALELIRAAGRPLPRKELFARLAAAGVAIAGKDPEMVLGTMLYRDDRIVRIRRYGYWPKNEIYEPAFYIPEHEGVIGVTSHSPDDDGD